MRQQLFEAIRDVRVNLQCNAEILRRFDDATAERIAVRLDRLRMALKPFAEPIEFSCDEQVGVGP